MHLTKQVRASNLSQTFLNTNPIFVSTKTTTQTEAFRFLYNGRLNKNQKKNFYILQISLSLMVFKNIQLWIFECIELKFKIMEKKTKKIPVGDLNLLVLQLEQLIVPDEFLLL